MLLQVEGCADNLFTDVTSFNEVIAMKKMAFAVVVAVGLSTVAPVQAQHVDYVASQIPPTYRGDIERFCKRGYSRHRWISVVPEMGIWMPIWKKFNTQYIPSFVQRCFSGGQIPS